MSKTLFYFIEDKKYRIKLNEKILVEEVIKKISEVNQIMIEGLYIDDFQLPLKSILFDEIDENDKIIIKLIENKIENPIINPNLNLTKLENFQKKEKFSDSNLKDVEFQLQKITLPNLEQNEFLIFSNLTYESLIKGDKIKLSTTIDYIEIKEIIIKFYELKYDIQGLFPIIYLSGGILFNKFKISKYFDQFLPKKNHIYIIFTRKIPLNLLDREISNILDISSDETKLLFTPLFESDNKGITFLCSFLGYISKDGSSTTKFLKNMNYIAPFAPTLISLNKLFNKESLKGIELIQITSVLQLLIRTFIQKEIVTEQCLQYCLPLFNYISNLSGYKSIKVIEKEVDWKYYSLYDEDFNSTYIERCQIPFLIPEEINSDFDSSDFKPIPPLSLKDISRTCIYLSENGVGICVASIDRKDSNASDKVTVHDPIKGNSEEISAEILAKRINNVSEDKKVSLVDKNKVEQVVYILFDNSGSMDTKDITSDQQTTRLEVAKQYLTTFANRAYGYRAASVFGLVIFNSSFREKGELSPLITQFEKSMDSVKSEGGTALFDCIKSIALKLSEQKKNYPNAQLRMVIISDGDDQHSNSKPEEVSQLLVEKGIIVDSCIINSGEDNCQRVAAISRITGGLSFKPKTINEGIKFFEQESFLYLTSREIKSPCLQKITPDIFKSYYTNELNPYSIEAPNKLILKGNQNEPLVNISLAIKENISSNSNDIKRILIELKKLNSALKTDKSIKVYPIESNIRYWKVLIEGPETSLYENYWWYLLVQFPNGYPINAPEFRFITVPYHINISDEGKICLNLLDKDYLSTYSIYELIISIKTLLLYPNPLSPMDAEKISIYKNSISQYNKNIKDFCLKRTKKKLEEFENEWDIEKEEKENEKYFEIEIPQQFKCPYSNLLMKDPVTAGTGITYERNSIESLFSNYKTPKCLITQKYLEKNKMISDKKKKLEILEFMKKNNINYN